MKKNLFISLFCALFALISISSCEEDTTIESMFRFSYYDISSTHLSDLATLEAFMKTNGLIADQIITGKSEDANRAEAIKIFDQKVALLDSKIDDLKLALKKANPGGGEFYFTYEVKGTYGLGEDPSKANIKAKAYTIKY